MSNQMIKYHKKSAMTLLLAIILLLVCTIGYPLIYEQARSIYDAELQKNESIARMAAYNIDDFLDEYKREVKRVATFNAVINQKTDHLREIAKTFHHVNIDSAVLWVTDRKGEVIAKYPQVDSLPNLSDREFFQQAIQEKPFVGGPYKGEITGEQFIMISKAYYKNRQVEGVVGLKIPLIELQNKLTTILADENAVIALVDQKGMPLASTNDRLEFKADDLSSDCLYTNVYLTEAPWRIVVIEEKSNQTALVYKIIARNLVLLMLFIIFLVFLIHYLFLLRDKKTALEAKEMEKLAVIGELAAGIAHEIRNPLTSIKGFVQLIDAKKIPEIPGFYTETMLSEIQQIEEIVDEMVVLAKPALETRTKIELTSLLKEIINVLSIAAASKNITIDLDSEPGLPLIDGVRTQLKQVFFNILENAIEATPDWGNIRIQAKYQTEEILITVCDNGIGMSPELLKKMGTPFFSTKESGTGLGLTVAYRIIQNHDGRIQMESELGMGTKVQIHIPIQG